MEWWLSNDVPGGMVQYRIREQGGEEVYTSRLSFYASRTRRISRPMHPRMFRCEYRVSSSR